MEEPLRMEDVGGTHTSQPATDVLRNVSDQCVINVPQNTRTIDTLGDSLPVLQEINCSACNNLPKYRSLSCVAPPAFMKTAVSSRADRRASETIKEAKPKSENWEFWHNSRQSSQTSLVPMLPVNGNDGHEDSSDKGSEAGGSQERKKSRGFKKMVKRFF